MLTDTSREASPCGKVLSILIPSLASRTKFRQRILGMLERYRLIKSLAEHVPVLAVFCDLALFRQRYGDVVRSAPFFDVFGFDYYAFTDNPLHARQWGRIAEWAQIHRSLPTRMPVMYVGQGVGARRADGQGNFGQVNMTSSDFDEQLSRVLGSFPDLDYYTLWDWNHADPKHAMLALRHLDRVKLGMIRPWPRDRPPQPKRRRPFFYFLWQALRSLF